MKYLLILIALMFGCDKPNGQLAEDFTNQLKLMEKKQKDLEDRLNKLGDVEYIRYAADLVEEKEEIENYCSEYLKLMGIKSPVLGKDYKAGLTFTPYYNKRDDGTIGSWSIGCKIFNKKINTNPEQYWVNYTESELRDKIKELLFEKYNKKG